MHKYVLNKPDFIKKEDKNKQKEVDREKELARIWKFLEINPKSKGYKTANSVFSNMSGIPSLSVFSSQTTALTGFSIANTKGYHNKLKKITFELLANTLILTIFISAVSLFVGKKSNKIKLPAFAGAVVAGTLTGK